MISEVLADPGGAYTASLSFGGLPKRVRFSEEVDVWETYEKYTNYFRYRYCCHLGLLAMAYAFFK